MLTSVETKRDEAVADAARRAARQSSQSLEDERLQAADALMKSAVEHGADAGQGSRHPAEEGGRLREARLSCPASEVVTDAHVEALKHAGAGAASPAQEEDFDQPPRRRRAASPTPRIEAEDADGATPRPSPCARRSKKSARPSATRSRTEFKELETSDPADMLDAPTDGKVRLLDRRRVQEAERQVRHRLHGRHGRRRAAHHPQPRRPREAAREAADRDAVHLRPEAQEGHQAPARRRGAAQVRQQADVDGPDGRCRCCRPTCARWCSWTAAASPPAT